MAAIFSPEGFRMVVAVIRVPSPYPDRAAFPAALARDAPILTRLHRLAAKTAWLIDSAAALHNDIARDAALQLAASAASLGTLRELDSDDPATVYAGLRERLAPIGTAANALRCIILDETLADRLAEIAFAVACLDQAVASRLPPLAGHGFPYPHGATEAAWRERFPDWALIADGWIMTTA